MAITLPDIVQRVILDTRRFTPGTKAVSAGFDENASKAEKAGKSHENHGKAVSRSSKAMGEHNSRLSKLGSTISKLTPGVLGFANTFSKARQGLDGSGRSASRAGGSFSKLGGIFRRIGGVLKPAIGLLGLFANKFTLIGAAAVAAAPSLIGLVGGLTALTSVIGSAMGVLPAFGIALGGLVAVAGVGKFIFGGVKDAMKQQEKAAKSGAATAKELAGAQERVADASRGVGEARKAEGKAHANIAEVATQAQRQIADASRGVTDARRAEGEAHANIAEVATQSQRQVSDAVRGVADAQRAQGEAHANVADVAIKSQRSIAEAIRGVTDAQRAQSEAQANVGEVAIAAQRRITDAVRGVTTARKAQGKAEAAVAAAAVAGQRSIADAVEARLTAQRSEVEALARVRDAQQAVNRSYKEAADNLRDLGRARQRADISKERAAIGLEEARVALSEAQVAGDREAIRSAVLDLRSAELDLADANDADTESQGALVDARRKGINQSDAVTEATANLRAAREGATDATRSVAEAERDLVDAQRSAAESTADAREQAVEATRATADAERDLADAHKSAAKDIADARQQAVDAARSVEDAERDLAEAHQSAAKDMVDARQQASDATRAVADAERDLADAHRSAGQDMVDARQQASDATRATADAERDLADAHKSAGQDIADARDSAAEATARVADATRDLAKAQAELNAVGKGEEEEEISAPVKALTAALADIKARLKPIREEAQAIAFPGIIKSLGIGMGLLDTLRPRINETAGIIGRGAVEISSAFASVAPEIDNIWGSANRTNESFVTLFSSAIGGAARFLNQGTFVNDYLATQNVRLGEWITKSTTGAEAQKRMHDFFVRALDSARTWGRIGLDTIGALFDIFKAAGDSGRSMSDKIKEAAGRWRDWTSSIEGQNAMKDWFENARRVTESLTRLLGDLWDALIGEAGSTDTLGKTADFLERIEASTAWSDFNDMLANLSRNFGPWVYEGMYNLADAVRSFYEVFTGKKDATNDVERMGVAFSDLSAVTDALKRFTDVVVFLTDTLKWMKDNVPFFDKIVGLMVTFMAVKFVAGKTGIGGIASALLALVLQARQWRTMNRLTTALENLGSGAQRAETRTSRAFRGIRNAFRRLRGAKPIAAPEILPPKAPPCPPPCDPNLPGSGPAPGAMAATAGAGAAAATAGVVSGSTAGTPETLSQFAAPQRTPAAPRGRGLMAGAAGGMAAGAGAAGAASGVLWGVSSFAPEGAADDINKAAGALAALSAVMGIAAPLSDRMAGAETRRAAGTATATVTTETSRLASIRHTIAEKARAVATKAVAAAQWLLNAAMSANPIMLIVIAVAALAAGLYLLYKNNEGFRKIIDQIWQGMQKAWDIVLPILQSIGSFLAGPVIAGFRLWWEAVQTYVGFIADKAVWFWDTVLYPVFQAIGWYITGVLIPVWTLIFTTAVNVFTWIAEKAQWFWNTILFPVFQLIWSYITNVLIPVWTTIFTTAVNVFTWIAEKATWFWTTILSVIFKAIWWYITSVLVPVWTLIFTTAVNVFTWIAEKATWFWTTILSVIFKAIWWYITSVLVPVWTLIFTTAVNVFTWIAEKATWFWTTVLSVIFQAIWGYITNVLIPGWTLFFTTASKVFTWIADKAVWFWNEILQPTFQRVWTFITETLIPKFIEFKDAAVKVFTWIAEKAQWFWNEILQPTFQRVWAFITETLIPKFIELKDRVIQVFTWISEKAQWFWYEILQPVFQKVRNFITETVIPKFLEMRDRVRAVFQLVSEKANWFWYEILKPIFEKVRNFITDTVIPKFIDLKNRVVGVWDTISTKVTDAWNTMRGIFDKIVFFVTGTLSSVWNNVTRAVGSAFDRIPELIRGALRMAGGVVAGFLRGAGGIADKLGLKDQIGKPLREAADSAAKWGGAAPKPTRGDDGKGARTYGRAAGGMVPLKDYANAPRREVGAGFVTNTPRAIVGEGSRSHPEFVIPTDPKYRGRAKSLWAAAGEHLVPAHASGAVLMKAAEWLRGEGARVTEHPRYGGVDPDAHSQTGRHYSNESGTGGDAIDVNFGPGGENNIEKKFFDRVAPLVRRMGLNVLWRVANHYNHLHADIGKPRGGIGGVADRGKAAIGGGVDYVTDALRDLAAGSLEKVWPKLPWGPLKTPTEGIMGFIPGAINKVRGAVIDKIKGEADQSGGGGGGGGGSGPVSGGGPVVAGSNRALGQQMAAARGWTGGQWNALDQLWQGESGWRNTAQNPTSTAYGIAQFLNSTWSGYGIAKTADPRGQIEAGMRYIAERYGTPAGALSAWQGRSPHWYAEGGVLPGFASGGKVQAEDGSWVPRSFYAKYGVNEDERGWNWKTMGNKRASRPVMGAFPNGLVGDLNQSGRISNKEWWSWNVFQNQMKKNRKNTLGYTRGREAGGMLDAPMSKVKVPGTVDFSKGGIVTDEVIGRIGEFNGRSEAVIPLDSPRADHYLGSGASLTIASGAFQVTIKGNATPEAIEEMEQVFDRKIDKIVDLLGVGVED